MCLGLFFFSTDLTTNDGYRDKVESIEGQELLAKSFPAGSGVDVVGAVEDLRPVRPAPDAVWHDPDRTRPRQVADAALDALVAVIEEAARREDPDDQLGARVSKVARRLRDR